MATEKIKYTGEFDVSGILNSLKQISSQMKNMSTNVSLFSGVDKDFEKLDKMIIDIKANGSVLYFVNSRSNRVKRN